MSKSRHTEAQMIAALKQGGAGRSSDLAYRRDVSRGERCFSVRSDSLLALWTCCRKRI
jgi:hypothetical protein